MLNTVRRDGEVLVRLKPGARPEVAARDHAATVVDRYELGKGPEAPEILRLKLPAGQTVEEGISELQQDPRVQYAVPNHVLKQLDKSPNDLHERLYGMAKIQAPQAWETTTGSRTGPVVAVIDGGIDYNHPDLAKNMWTNPGEIPGDGLDNDGNGVVDDVHGFDAANKDGDPMDDSGHGTHCAGTVGAEGDNGQGVVGVNWQAQLMGVKFLSGGFGDTADAIEGILYATKMGARITSNSWGGPLYNQALYDALAASPALHLCAAGNDSNDNDIVPMYPASYDLPNVVTVAATDEDDRLASFSNKGATTVELAAPGVRTYSTVPNGEYGSKSGTSMATPHVSGVAALIATQYPAISNQELKDRLIFGVDRLPQLEGQLISGGRLNALRSLEDDRVGPGEIGELSAGPGTATELPLSWLATGDDGAEGTAAAYEVAWSPRPITAENFAQAVQLRTPPPQAAGARETAHIHLHPSSQERELHVAVRAVDNVGNRGPLQSTTATLPAAQVQFEDDGENGAERWTAEGSWSLVDFPGRGKVWTDSPGGEYGLNLNASLTSQVFSLEGLQSAKLNFECKHDLEITFDKVFLEASRDGQAWSELASFNLLKGWEEKSYDLTPFVGGPLQLRFRLKTDGDVTKDGFYLDNLVVTGERV